MIRSFVFLFVLFFYASLLWGLDYETIKKAYYESYRLEAQGRYAEARKALIPVYKSFPRAYTVNLRLGWLFYLEGRYRNAAKHYEVAASAAPRAVEPVLGLGLVYAARNQWQKVEELMYRVLKVDYYNYYANLRLAYALRKQKKFRQAELVCRKMLALYPTDVSFLEELALILLESGRKKEAEAIFADILILDPKNRTAIKHFRKND